MTWKENLFQNLLTALILMALIIIVYLRVSRKTIGDLIRDIRGGFKDE